MYLWENGLLKRWITKYYPNIEKCRVKNWKPTGKASALKLNDMWGAFVLLGLGLSVSFLIYLMELIASLRKEREATLQSGNIETRQAGINAA